MQVLFLGRAPRTKETLPDFLKWRRVTRPPLVFRGLTGSQRTPGFWGVTGELPEDSSSFACRSISSGAATSLPLSGREGGNGRGGSRECLAQSTSNRVSRGSFSSHNRFACSCNSAICLACFSYFASISWRQRRNWSLGAKFAGLLVMALNSDGPVGCWE